MNPILALDLVLFGLVLGVMLATLIGQVNDRWDER